MKTEDLVIDEGGKGEVIEEVGEGLPNICISILSEALIVEAVNLSNLTGFVITTKDGDSLWVSYL